MARPPRLIIAEDDDENDDDSPLPSSRRVVLFDALVVFCPIDEEATNNGAFSEEGKAPTMLDIFTSSKVSIESQKVKKKKAKKKSKKKEGKKRVVCQYVRYHT